MGQASGRFTSSSINKEKTEQNPVFSDTQTSKVNENNLNVGVPFTRDDVTMLFKLYLSITRLIVTATVC